MTGHTLNPYNTLFPGPATFETALDVPVPRIPSFAYHKGLNLHSVVEAPNSSRTRPR